MLKNKTLKYFLLGILLTLFALYFMNETIYSYINNIFFMFTINPEKIKIFINSHGKYAILISFLLMIFQSIVAPLPAFLITFANATLFGWWQGAILSWVSSMTGATLCFYISRILGRDTVEKLTGKSSIKKIDTFFSKYGSYTILVCRLLPFISFDIVSYAAGLTSLNFLSFFIATGLGQLPATIIYSYVGGMLTGGAKTAITGLFILFSLTIIIYMLKKIFRDKKKL